MTLTQTSPDAQVFWTTSRGDLHTINNEANAIRHHMNIKLRSYLLQSLSELAEHSLL